MVYTIILLISLCYILYKFSTWNFDYWKKRGVPYVKPTPFFGNFLGVFTFRTTIGHLLARFYKQFDTPYFGAFVWNVPHLIVRDTNLIKTILVKEFSSFSDRTVLSDEKCDSIASKFLFFVKNPEWRVFRVKAAPVFTSGKLKSMMPLINDVAENMNIYLNKNLNHKSLDAKEVCAKYATDVIASCAFGITANSFENENAEFRVTGSKMFGYNLYTAIRQISYFVAPGLVKLLKIPFFESDVATFMRNVFFQTLDEREKTNFKRNDLIDIIVQIKREGLKDAEFEFVGDRVVALAAQFYAAGFETVSSALAFTLYELCINSDIQTKLQSEIKDTILEHGKLSYDTLHSMKYLDMVVCETLRKYPVLPFLDRTCIQDYKVPDSNFVIEKGTRVYIPIFGLHYDKNYFPDPETFDPERFSVENKSKIPPFAYIPFGEGPRICIGERFGLLTVKLGLALILNEYELERSYNTPVPLVYETKSFLMASNVGLSMKFKKIVSKID